MKIFTGFFLIFFSFFLNSCGALLGGGCGNTSYTINSYSIKCVPPPLFNSVITDKITHQPVADVRIDFRNNQFLLSGKDGFVIAQVKPGKYTITISKVGYKVITKEIKVPFDSSIELDPENSSNQTQ